MLLRGLTELQQFVKYLTDAPMKYSLRSLMIVAMVGPPLLAVAWVALTRQILPSLAILLLGSLGAFATAVFDYHYHKTHSMRWLAVACFVVLMASLFGLVAMSRLSP